MLYGDRLVREGVVTSEDVAALRKRASARLGEAFDAAQQHTERFEVQELSAVPDEEITTIPHATAVDQETLAQVVHGATSFPENFHLHPKLHGFIWKRKETFEKGGALDRAV